VNKAGKFSFFSKLFFQPNISCLVNAVIVRESFSILNCKYNVFYIQAAQVKAA